MRLELQRIGPIKQAELAFGDLTVLIGPQASGKSIALQMLKLMVDVGYVQHVMTTHGLDWSNRLPEFLDVYFGEGMHGIWNDKSRVLWRGQPVDLNRLASRRRRNTAESLFYIPAQRVLALRDGWPRPFSDYAPSDPFTLREFSEKLRTLVEREFSGSESLFPQKRRLKREFREMLQSAVFGDFPLRVDKLRAQKRLVLGATDEPLPFMVWSAGQREFVPLLLGLYWLMPPTKVSRRGTIQWVVLEELEMGLHPQAISVVVLLVFELVRRGYRVCLSTHCPQVLEVIWTLRHLRQSRASAETLLQTFGAPTRQPMRDLAQTVMNKNLKVYYFDGSRGQTKDISALDPASEEAGEADWGGLMQFSGRANAAVADAVANAQPEGQQ